MTRVVRAPGRVNLIGEHTDYNDGWVLPMAIDREVRLEFEPLDEPRVELRSDRDAPIAFGLGDIGPGRRVETWADYVGGVAWALADARLPIRGLRGELRSDLPIGSGLSSSAALEMAVAWALLEAPETVDPMTLARLAQRAENEVVGVRSGIMDQAAVALGRAGHALLLDCRSLEVRQVPLPERAAIVVIDSGASRSLAGSAYNERRAQCEAAVEILSRRDGAIRSLRDVTPEALEAWIGDLPPPLDRRARHVVTENARVHAVVDALETGDLSGAGAHLDASHASLRDDYEVSSAALDALVDIARAVPGVHGARLTGAGFGGCTVNLVDPDAVPALSAAVAGEYEARTGLAASVMPVRAVDGAGWG